MANKINLLPTELNIHYGSGRINLIFKRLSFLTAVVFFVGTIAALSYMFYLSRQVNTERDAGSKLRDTLASLDQTEQKLFLIKDRIARADQVLSDKQSEESISKLSDTLIIASASSDLSFASAKIDTGNTELGLSTSKLFSLSSFVDTLVASSPFRQIVLKSIGFNAFTGYSLNLQLF